MERREFMKLLSCGAAGALLLPYSLTQEKDRQIDKIYGLLDKKSRTAKYTASEKNGSETYRIEIVIDSSAEEIDIRKFARDGNEYVERIVKHGRMPFGFDFNDRYDGGA